MAKAGRRRRKVDPAESPRDILSSQANHPANDTATLVLDVSSVAVGAALLKKGKVVASEQVFAEGKALSDRLGSIARCVAMMMIRAEIAAVIIEEPFSGMGPRQTNAATIRACIGAWGSAVAGVDRGIPVFVVHPASWQAVILRGVAVPPGVDKKTACHIEIEKQNPLVQRLLQSGGMRCEDQIDAICIAEAVLRDNSIAKRV